MTDEVVGEVPVALEEIESLRKRVEILEQEKKDLESFSYTVAHDLHSPLLRVEWYSRILQKECADEVDELYQNSLRGISRGAQQARRMLGGLYYLSRAAHSDLNLEDVDLSALSREILSELVQTEPERKVRVEIQQGIKVCADPGLAALMMENLLGNAWKFTSKNEVAHIEVGCVAGIDERICFVRDDGVGFDGVESGRLFDVFQRMRHDKEFEGDGIGLETVQRIIQRHRGRVWAEGVANGGATFYFVFPDVGPVM